MVFFRWTLDFKYNRTSLFQPIWVKLPSLRRHLFDEAILKRIISTVGIPIRVDRNSLFGDGLITPRIIVKVDLREEREPFIYVNHGG